MNANMIFKWLRDPRYAPGREASSTDVATFLPVEIVGPHRNTVMPPLPEPAPTAGMIEIDLAGGHRMQIGAMFVASVMPVRRRARAKFWWTDPARWLPTNCNNPTACKVRRAARRRGIESWVSPDWTQNLQKSRATLIHVIAGEPSVRFTAPCFPVSSLPRRANSEDTVRHGRKDTEMKRIFGIAAAFMVIATVPAIADPDPTSWGQQVKACNSSDCYPGGTSRGEYVRTQATDEQTPGYGQEIHDLANPGNSDPKGEVAGN